MSRSAMVSTFWDRLDTFPDFPRALCSSMKKPLWDFQTSDEERYLVRSRRHNKAIRICKQCVHASDCYAWGLAHDMHGVWGGVVLVPNGRSYFRCRKCGYAMIKSRYQKPPRDFRNRYTDDLCSVCA